MLPSSSLGFHIPLNFYFILGFLLFPFILKHLYALWLDPISHIGLHVIALTMNALESCPSLFWIQ